MTEARPSSKLQAALDAMSDAVRQAFMSHLIGDTSAEYLSDWLERAGTPVSPSSIRTYRRALRRSGV